MRKAQAAMEFLLTYGWAILVVMGAIAALAAFGVFDNNQILPEQTLFPAPIPAIDNAYVHVVHSSGTDNLIIEIPFKNNKGNPISFPSLPNGLLGDFCVPMTNANVYGYCHDSGCSNLQPPNDALTTFSEISHNARFILQFRCQNTAFQVGDNVDFTLGFNYLDTETGLTHQHTGTIRGTVSA